jgi:hypothetical protein
MAKFEMKYVKCLGGRLENNILIYDFKITNIKKFINEYCYWRIQFLKFKMLFFYFFNFVIKQIREVIYART